MNWIVTIVIGGIVGSSLGFWLAGTLGLAASGPVISWVGAVVGAALLIVVLKAVGVFK